MTYIENHWYWDQHSISILVSYPASGLPGELYKTYRHRQKSRFGMLMSKILIIEFTQSINTSRARTISIQEITALTHEILDLYNMLEVTSRERKGVIQFDEIYCLCILAVYQDDFWFRRYRIDGNFRPSWEPHRRRAQIGCDRVAHLVDVRDSWTTYLQNWRCSEDKITRDEVR